MKKNIADFLIVLLIVSYDFLRMLGMNNKIVLVGYLTLLIIFLSGKIITNKITKKELLKMVLLFIIGAFSTIYVGEVNLIIAILAATYFLNTDENKIVKYFFVTIMSWYILVVLLYFIGVLDNNSLIRITENEIKVRNSLGFSHVNQTFLYLLPIIFSSYILYFDKYRKKYSLCIFFISTVLYLITNCRTGYFSVIVFLLLINLKTTQKKHKINIPALMFILFTIGSILIIRKYGSNGSNAINSMLSLRPYYLFYYLKNFSLVTLKGGHFIANIPMDNVYIYLLLEKGIIIYLFYLIIIRYYFSKCEYDIKIKNIIYTSLLYGLFESYIVLPSINFVFILILMKVVKHNKQKE